MPRFNKLLILQLLIPLLLTAAMQSGVVWAIQAPVSVEATEDKLTVELTGRLRPLFLSRDDFCGIDGVLTRMELKDSGSYISPGKILGFTRPGKRAGTHAELRDKFLARQRRVLAREVSNNRISRSEQEQRTKGLEEALERAKKTKEYPFFAFRSAYCNGKPPAIGTEMEFISPFGDPTLNKFARSDSVCSLELTVPADKKLLVRSLFHLGAASQKTDVHLVIDAGNYTELQDTISWSQFSLEAGQSLTMHAKLPIHDFFESDMRKVYPCSVTITANAPADVKKRAMQVAKLWERVEADNPVAMVALARCLQTGFGGEPDPFMAIKLLERAAEMKNGSAMYELSLVYREGVWVGSDLDKANDLLRQAAQAGSLAARLELGQ